MPQRHVLVSGVQRLLVVLLCETFQITGNFDQSGELREQFATGCFRSEPSRWGGNLLPSALNGVRDESGRRSTNTRLKVSPTLAYATWTGEWLTLVPFSRIPRGKVFFPMEPQPRVGLGGEIGNLAVRWLLTSDRRRLTVAVTYEQIHWPSVTRVTWL